MYLPLDSRILRNKIGTNSSGSVSCTSSLSSAVSAVTTNHSGSSYQHHHNASTSFTASYPLDSKENVRQALTAVAYNPIYGAYPTSNISNSVVPTAISSSFHGIYLSNSTSTNDDLSLSTGGLKAPSWPSPHSVTDLLSVGNNALSATSQLSPVTSSPSSATPTAQFAPTIGTDPNGMLTAVAQTNHYMQNYYMQLMHSHTHNPPPITSLVNSMTSFQ